MASVSLVDLTGASCGILMPVLQNRWTIHFPESGDILTRQAIRGKADYLKKKLSVVIEQSIDGAEHISVLALLDRSSVTIQLTAMDGNEGAYHIVEFNICKAVSHEMVFDYALNASVKHEITFEFKDIRVLRRPELLGEKSGG